MALIGPLILVSNFPEVFSSRDVIQYAVLYWGTLRNDTNSTLLELL
ncbi:hypothetical protein SNOG_15930 [Parastagonospora nodorum SN15]|uniref:Uncharacterized protein n=1 Tax=Phaeosphaeria nodorum (strain SN15 / ATCC MYA-4574 / FGSC 10173) TaxID=321614 RepID=Q0TXB7_PHANO|nr:hypothetical protein SNOG_15930 [Parastagonospora nodorum SN15]EAT76768.1 hypothetical protein SNOG_15930 [Parastagonospora nodorum SN15]